jgi:hypothetical protein
VPGTTIGSIATPGAIIGRLIYKGRSR